MLKFTDSRYFAKSRSFLTCLYETPSSLSSFVSSCSRHVSWFEFNESDAVFQKLQHSEYFSSVGSSIFWMKALLSPVVE